VKLVQILGDAVSYEIIGI